MAVQFATWQTHSNVATQKSWDDNVKAWHTPPITDKKYPEYPTPFREDLGFPKFDVKTLGNKQNKFLKALEQGRKVR